MNILPKKSDLKKTNASKVFIGFVIAAFIVITYFGTRLIISDQDCASCNVYKAIGFIIIMLWICIFLCYFIWAVYYYNLNLGKTNAEWAKINEAKNNRTKGLPFDQNDIDEEPKYNPYKEETFGLPSGTVRGMIAFTLLFSSIAMLIVSFGMDKESLQGSLLLEKFEFFKTAFLMMIAFYFGSRSLKLLKDNSKKDDDVNNSAATSNVGGLESPVIKQAIPTVPDKEKEIIIINNDVDNAPPEDGSVPPIVAIDPMAPKKK